MKRIYRYEVPVDDQIHVFDIWSNPVAVGCRSAETVEFWAQAHDDGLALRRAFVVVGTGQPLPETMRRHWGTAVAPGGALVWHLIEVALPALTAPRG